MPIFPVSTVPSFEEPHKNPTRLAVRFSTGFLGDFFVGDFWDFWDFCLGFFGFLGFLLGFGTQEITPRCLTWSN